MLRFLLLPLPLPLSYSSCFVCCLLRWVFCFSVCCFLFIFSSQLIALRSMRLVLKGIKAANAQHTLTHTRGQTLGRMDRAMAQMRAKGNGESGARGMGTNCVVKGNKTLQLLRLPLSHCAPLYFFFCRPLSLNLTPAPLPLSFCHTLLCERLE